MMLLKLEGFASGSALIFFFAGSSTHDSMSVDERVRLMPGSCLIHFVWGSSKDSFTLSGGLGGIRFEVLRSTTTRFVCSSSDECLVIVEGRSFAAGSFFT